MIQLMESSYQQLPKSMTELAHDYGSNVHILTNPMTATVLAKLGHPDCYQPELNSYIAFAYGYLLQQAVNHLFPTTMKKTATRMKEFTDKGYYQGEVLDEETKVIVVDLARAGIYPSHLLFEQLHFLLKPQGLRQDHFYINRKTNDQGEVIGVDVSGSKIGGGQEGAFVLFPDPMGATGGSLSHCVDHYKKHVEGKAQKYVALHLIVTPEYIARMQKDHPDVEIFALRLDRGLSEDHILTTRLGSQKDQERGLTDNHYIVPGAGGLGEVLNNSFV